jgi:hypothetical protein
LTLATQAAIQQQNRSLLYLQAPKRFARRDNLDTVACGLGGHVSNVILRVHARNLDSRD